MFDVAQIERALKDADRYIASIDDENRWPDTEPVRSAITAALINLRKVSTEPGPTRAEIMDEIDRSFQELIANRANGTAHLADRILALRAAALWRETHDDFLSQVSASETARILTSNLPLSPREIAAARGGASEPGPTREEVEKALKHGRMYPLEATDAILALFGRQP